MYLATSTRPDLGYAVCELAHFMPNYSKRHWVAVKHLLRYLQGTRTLGLTFGAVDNPYPIFRGFTDSDWASGEFRRSILGYVMMLDDSPIAWSSRQQSIIVLSSCEAKYIACSYAACEVLWLRNLFGEISFPPVHATDLFCDNNGTIASTHDPHGHSQMKHIDICDHFIQDCINKKLITVLRIAGLDNIADKSTKSLACMLHSHGLELLGLCRDQGGVL